MATLVLTTVGRVIGGPIGGALGALAGQAIDGRLFRGAAREGPRLTDLAVQTSSYGTPIPRLFGTIRVAGTVIWSTDLIETRSASRAGKGQPGTNTYSYAASFAVALSARPIRAVRRIWAEGKLLRGAAGDWKSQTGFRLHPGDEDQPVDPLIASAMGVTPAYRGIAYAVFEGMQLADYGNRIPSLTFEVEADAAAVASGAIAAALGDDVQATGGVPVDGFAASGASVRAVIETLATIDGGWWRPVGSGVERREDSGPATVLVDRGVGVRGDGERRHRTVAGQASAPREVAVAHHDPARDYQIGVQRVRRPGPGERIDRVELPAVLPATVAKGVAAALVARGERERVRRRVTLDVDALAVAPGDIVTLDGEPERWRVAAMRVEALVTTLDLVPLGPMPVVGRASSGHVAGAADLTAGRTLLVAAEWPCLDDLPLSAPRIHVIATGEGAGWRQAALLYSLDDGASWTSAGGTAAPGIVGRVEGGLMPASARLVDRTSRMVVTLARPDMMLGDADAAMRAGGANLALVGDELLQFERAEPMGAGRWVLTGLRRGLRGTEAAIAARTEGARFALIERDGVVAIDLPLAAIGRTVRLLATGVGDVVGPAVAEVRVTGASVAPPAPVHVVMEPAPDGARMLRWTRRSRAGWAWRDGVDVPLAEEREAYRVVVIDRDGTERPIEVGEPRCVVTAEGSGAGIAAVRIAQRGTLAMSADTIVPWEEDR